MAEMDDHQLLTEFARENSETAFTALVTQHVGLVYSVALRSTGNTHAAEEITQAVFIILAKKAAGLSAKIILSGWLYQTTRLTAANYLRTEIRRQHREHEAHMQSLLNETQMDDGETWHRIAPLLDDAIGKLGARDRDAIALRFFENKSLAEVGAALGASEDAAKMRVNRALEKLRKIFTKRGVTLSALAIAGAVAANSVQAAPVGLAKTISVVAFAKGAAAGGSTLTLVKGTLKLMAWTKAKTAILAGVIVLLAAGTTTLTVKKIEQHRADDSWRTQPFDSRVLEHLSPQVKILPAKLPRGGGWGNGMGGKMMGTGVTLEAIVPAAYGFWYSGRTIFSTELPKSGYDYIASLPSGNAEALQQEIKKQFGVIARLEIIETNVLVLKIHHPDAQGLRPNTTRSKESQLGVQPGHYSCVNSSISDLSINLENILRIPVVNQTGLTQNFDIDLKWNRNDPQQNSLKQALLDQLGLELVPSRESIEMLVVEKAN